MISVQGVYKHFGALEVLRGVGCQFATGRITALIGPNSVGKTTLLKCILGLVRATRGDILVDGQQVGRDPAWRANMGYMPQLARFPDNLTANDLMAMLAHLRQDTPERDETLLDQFQLRLYGNTPLRVLSGGTRQKVSAVLAFLFRPRLVLLDEPSAGLDPMANSVLKDKIRAERRKGCTIILTSHIMSEVDELADDLVCLDEGTVRYAGSVEALKLRTHQFTLERAIAALMAKEGI